MLTHGGAIAAGDGNSLGCSVTLSGCTLTGNSAVYGGAVYSGTGGWGPVTVAVTGGAMSGNVAAISGGAMYMTTNGYTNVNVSTTVNGCCLSETRPRPATAGRFSTARSR